MNPWHKGVLYGLDFESTGTDPTEARIVTACLIGLHPDKRRDEHQWLVNPHVEIPQATTDIHGVTTARAQAEGREPVDFLVELMDLLTSVWQAGWPVVGHNLGGYDLTLLEHELHRHGLGDLRTFGGPGFVVDTLCIDKGLRKRVSGKGARKLDALTAFYQVPQDQAHDAKNDAVASARVAWRMCEAYPEALQVDLHDLMERQEWTHRAWAEDFESYLRTQGSGEVIGRDWPYVPVAAKAVLS